MKAVYWFCMLNAYKYRYRAGNKDGNSAEQDEAKALWYDKKAEEMLNKHIEKNAGMDGYIEDFVISMR